MSEPTSSDPTRRRVVTGAVVSGLASAAPTPTSARARTASLDLSTPQARLRAFMRLRGALDGRLVIGFVVGRYHGVVDDELRLLFGVHGATFARYRLRPDGGYDGASYEISYFTDLETGAVLDRFANPYTGEAVEPPRTNYPPAALVVTPALEIQVPKPPPGLTVEIRVLPPVVAGGEVWITEQTRSAFSAPGGAKPVRYGELVTLHARAADLVDPTAARVRCDTAYTALVGWRPWLKMADRPGHLLVDGEGSYGVALADLPAPWRAGAARFRPEALADPGRPLAGLMPG